MKNKELPKLYEKQILKLLSTKQEYFKLDNIKIVLLLKNEAIFQYVINLLIKTGKIELCDNSVRLIVN